MRERAVRMVQEHRSEYPSLWAAIESIAPKVCCVPPTLLEWVKKAEVDSGELNSLSPTVLQPRDAIKHRFAPRNMVQAVRHKVPKALKLKLLVRLRLGQ